MTAGATPRLSLDLAVRPEEAPTLVKLIGAKGKGAPLRVIWHDTSDTVLAREGRLLAEHRAARAATWRLERWWPDPGDPAGWAPGAPAALLAEAPDVAGVSLATSDPLVPIAAFDGRSLTAKFDEAATATLLAGTVRAVAGETEVVRLLLEGPAASVGARAEEIVAATGARIASVPLAIEAYAAARHILPHPRHGPPILPDGLDIGDAFAFVTAHLSAAILALAPAAAAGADTEAVHQMRVASRRLRSAIQLFRKPLDTPEIPPAETLLKALAGRLGPARDWDVFVSETLREIAVHLPDEAALGRLLRRAQHRREAAYANLRAYLDGIEFRRFGLAFAILCATRPWRDRTPDIDIQDVDGVRASADTAGPIEETSAAGTSPPASTAGDLTAFARSALDKRLKRLLAPGRRIKRLPSADLHAIRLDAKRLRYVGEFCAPLFPDARTRRFMRRLSRLQEALGGLNDGAVAAALLEEIGQSRSYVGGLVRGFSAAGAGDRRDDLARAWRKLRRAPPFWRGP